MAKQQKHPAREAQYQYDAEEEEIDFIVPDEKFEIVKNSNKLKPMLTNSKLRKVIREIDSSRNRTRRLWQQLETDPDFRLFVDQMLQEMGYLDENN